MSDNQYSLLNKAMALAQSEMRSIKKDSLNPFFKAKYADLSSVCDYAYPILSKHGLSVTQPSVMVDGKLYIKTMLLHDSGVFIEAIWPVTGDTQQQMGSATSYARRYSLMSIIGLSANGDDDDAESLPKSIDQLDETKKLAAKHKVSSEQVLTFIKEKYSKTRVTDLDKNEIVELNKFITKG